MQEKILISWFPYRMGLLIWMFIGLMEKGPPPYFGDGSVENFEWMMPADERFIRQIRQYEGQPDTVYLEFYSFEKNRFVAKDTSFGMVNYAVFERQ